MFYSLPSDFRELSCMNNYLGLGLDAKITYEFNTRRDENPSQYKLVWFAIQVSLVDWLCNNKSTSFDNNVFTGTVPKTCYCMASWGEESSSLIHKDI